MIRHASNHRIQGLWLLLMGVVVLFGAKALLKAEGSSRAAPQARVFVEIKGAVAYPGVYGVERSPSLEELLTRAGGRISGKETPIDVGTLVVAGTRVRVEEDGSVHMDDMSAFVRMTLGMPLLLNRETVDGLTALPGIGPRTAARVVEERTKRNGFGRLEDLQSVPGIGPYLYKRIRPHLVLGERT